MRRLKFLGHKILSWLRKLFQMNNHIYYCRFYVNARKSRKRFLIPMFINGKSEMDIEETILNIINAIHKSGNYAIGGLEDKYLVIDHPLFTNELKAIVKNDVLKGEIVDFYVSKHNGYGLDEVSGLPILFFDTKELKKTDGNFLKMKAISIKVDHVVNERMESLPLSLVG